MRRKIIVYIATSADGYIARPDGDVEWLNRRPHTMDYGMGAFYRTIDTILWGRKTYDWLLAYYKKKGRTKGLFDTKVTNYVFSRTPPRRTAPGAEFVRESVKSFARQLRATPGKHIWMMGGGGLIASFLDAGEIDELDIHVIPVMIGKGIPPRRAPPPGCAAAASIIAKISRWSRPPALRGPAVTSAADARPVARRRGRRTRGARARRARHALVDCSRGRERAAA